MIPEIVLKIDELGRIIIPIEIRKALGWDSHTKISISRKGEKLLLQTYLDSCFICGNEDNLKTINGKYICQNCMNELKQKQHH